MITIAVMPFVIILVFGALMIIGGTIVLLYIVKAVKGSPRMDDEEAKLMQDLYEGLEKMDKRVEALETLLLDGEGKETES